MEEKSSRKPTRLQNFDYGTTGAYFVTICTQDRQRILSEIIKPNIPASNCSADFQPVGEGLAPPAVRLTKIGEIVEEQLLSLEDRYSHVEIIDYVIMPDHIHAIIFLRGASGGASPSPTSYRAQCDATVAESFKCKPITLNDVVCAFKSLTSRDCKKQFGLSKLFQRSFYDHVIRDRNDYETRKKYIYENPIKWYYDKIYEDE